MGYGVGYEMLFSAVSKGGDVSTRRAHGIDFARLAFGLDMAMSEQSRGGFFVEGAVGRYFQEVVFQEVVDPDGASRPFGTTRPSVSRSMDEGAWHVWMTAGVRAVFLP